MPSVAPDGRWFADVCHDGAMRRVVGADLVLDVPSPSDLVLSVAVAGSPGLDVVESLSVALDGAAVGAVEILDAHGTRLHRIRVGAGRLSVEYTATVLGRGEAPVSDDAELIGYLRPSRYCESDLLAPTAWAEFAGVEDIALLDAVSSWVGTRLAYVPGSSLATDGAVRTLLGRRGVCRDFAHLCAALLRARGVPARVVAVYAPGLKPMDFHAVCEAFVDGRWLVVDATALGPRSSMLRIATGRDAADTAFLTTLSGSATLVDLEVTATVDSLPSDDVTAPVQLG